MPDPIAATAPAQPEAPVAQTPPPTPSQQAVTNNDFSGYRAAKREERIAPAKPAEPVKEPIAAAPTPAAIVEPKKTSNRQDRINEYERTIAQLRADVDRLKTPPAAALAPKVDAKPAESDPEPDPSDATKYPDGQYDRKFLKDQARWEARDELRAHDASQQALRSQEQAARTRADAEKSHGAQTKAFVEKVTAARESDAAAFDRIDPKLFDLTPSIARPAGEPITFGHAVADALLTSEHPVALMLHLSDPAEVDRLANLPPDGFYRELGRIEQRLAASLAPAPPPLPKLSSAPPPAPTVGERPATPSDPAKRAIAESNFTAYRAAKSAERLALHR